MFLSISLLLQGENIDNLLESILAQAELLDLKADYSGPVKAVVVESKITKGLGWVIAVYFEQDVI